VDSNTRKVHVDAGDSGLEAQRFVRRKIPQADPDLDRNDFAISRVSGAFAPVVNHSVCDSKLKEAWSWGEKLICLRGAKMVLEFQASDWADSVGTSDRRCASDQQRH
jgi:hypothetical protein